MPTIPLTKLSKNCWARVAEVVRDDSGQWRKLLAFGVVPGAMVLVSQRFPAIVVRCGETEIALDDEAAMVVLVEEPA